jgi:hypothetical protein
MIGVLSRTNRPNQATRYRRNREITYNTRVSTTLKRIEVASGK